MLTDRPPRKARLLESFQESDRLTALELPQDNRLLELARMIALGMKDGMLPAVRDACSEFLACAADFYGVRRPEVRALAARPLRVREGGWASELFGDYTINTTVIRIWTRTAVRKQVTSYGTFLSTLCHEFCHHLDCERFGFRHTPHTRGFYQRTAALYHHARGTPMKRLFWVRVSSGRWRIDWQKTNTQAGGGSSSQDLT